MAYVLKRNRLKSGDTVFYINTVNRVPGTKNKQKEMMLEKYSRNSLISEGKDPEVFMASRLARLKADSKVRSSAVGYSIDLSLPLELSEDGGDKKVNDGLSNLGFIPYSQIYHTLELDELINNRRRSVNAEYNINVVFQHLLYSRILWPASKRNTWEHRKRLFGDTEYALHDVYRSMDYILKWRTDILEQADRAIKKNYGRKNTVIFYDVTNYYFEIDDEDPDEIDGKSGEARLRARGVSKEHRPNPIIQMGMFMDEQGLPITYELFRGNTNDSVTLHEAMDRCIIDFSGKRRIIVADKGMMSYYNILKIREARNGYVISQAIRKSDAETKAFALSEDGWKMECDSDGNVVSMIKERTIPRKASTYGDVDASRHSGTYNERQVFIWSKKYADRAERDRNAAVEKAKKFLGTRPKDFKDSNYGKSRYLNKKALKDGIIVEHDGCIYEFNESGLEEERKYDGLYIICTNVIGVDSTDQIRDDRPSSFSYYREKDGFLVLNHLVPASEIVDIYGGLWKIEETFKVSKTGMLSLRPIFHSRDDRIRAHFLLTFISMLLERILELRMDWKYSSKTIQDSLAGFNATLLPKSNVYLLTYYDLAVQEILKTFDIDISKKFLLQNDIRKIIGKTKKKSYET